MPRRIKKEKKNPLVDSICGKMAEKKILIATRISYKAVAIRLREDF